MNQHGSIATDPAFARIVELLERNPLLVDCSTLAEIPLELKWELNIAVKNLTDVPPAQDPPNGALTNAVHITHYSLCNGSHIVRFNYSVQGVLCRSNIRETHNDRGVLAKAVISRVLVCMNEHLRKIALAQRKRAHTEDPGGQQSA